MPMRVIRNAGRRGAFYALFGFLALLFGLGSQLDPPREQALVNARVITAIAPLNFWYASWTVVGFLCFLAIYIKRLERITSGAYAGLAGFFSMGYFLAQFIVPGSQRPWILALFFFGLSSCIMLLAGWPEAQQQKGHKK